MRSEPSPVLPGEVIAQRSGCERREPVAADAWTPLVVNQAAENSRLMEINRR
jgi:hypothetical protein